jgi:inorganic pyrophosphatase
MGFRLVAPAHDLHPLAGLQIVRPVGVLVMEDDGGEDEKIIAVPSRKLTQRYNRVENYTDLPDITVSPPGMIARVLATSTSHGSPSPERVCGMKP